MPFKSKAQQRFMFAKHPGIAKRWVKEYGVSHNMPEKATTPKEILLSRSKKKK